jgi:hypothetical protein
MRILENVAVAVAILLVGFVVGICLGTILCAQGIY